MNLLLSVCFVVSTQQSHTISSWVKHQMNASIGWLKIAIKKCKRILNYKKTLTRYFCCNRMGVMTRKNKRFVFPFWNISRRFLKLSEVSANMLNSLASGKNSTSMIWCESMYALDVSNALVKNAL